MKKPVIVSALLGMLIFLSACGNQQKVEELPSQNDLPSTETQYVETTIEPTNEQTETTQESLQESVSQTNPDFATSKTYDFFQDNISGNYIMNIKISEDIVDKTTEMNAIVAYNDGDSYYEIESTQNHVTQMIRNNTLYIILHDEKTYMVSAVFDNKDFDTSLFDEQEIIQNENRKTGIVNINGSSYPYESFTEDKSVKYCFDGQQLRYILTSENGNRITTEIVSISRDIPADLFDIPSSYKETSYGIEF